MVLSQVQLFEPERHLGWTGTLYTAKAIHIWQLTPEPGGRTLVRVDESLEGPLVALFYPSSELVKDDQGWLMDLKKAAEGHP